VRLSTPLLLEADEGQARGSVVARSHRLNRTKHNEAVPAIVVVVLLLPALSTPPTNA